MYISSRIESSRKEKITVRYSIDVQMYCTVAKEMFLNSKKIILIQLNILYHTYRIECHTVDKCMKV